MTRIVGIGGKLRHGKDAVSDRLVENHGWVKMGMSDPLHDIYLKENRWIRVETHISHPLMRKVLFKPGFYRYREIFEKIGYVEAKKIPQVREDLQILGTEIGRDMIDINIWTDLMKGRVRSLIDQGIQGVIVTGIRFQNELDAIEDLGGETWWVKRPNMSDNTAVPHRSERSVSEYDFDLCIRNDGTLEDLHRKVDNLVK